MEPPGPLVHVWYTDPVGEQPWLQFFRTEAGYLLRFPALADYEISRDLASVVCRPVAGVPEETLEHLLHDQVYPLVLSRKETLVLHASAVAIGDVVIGFGGRSGMGKSTLAASFGLDGYPVLCDDCLTLRHDGGWTVSPAYAGVRLWPQNLEALVPDAAGESRPVAHYTSKRRLASLPFDGTERPFRALYLLERGESVGMQPMQPQEAYIAALQLAFNLDITDQEFLKKQMDVLSQFVADVPVKRLSYPREYARLREVKDLLLQELGCH